MDALIVSFFEFPSAMVSRMIRSFFACMSQWFSRYAVALCLSIALTVGVDAQIPRKINYQGYLTTPNGAPINNASLPMALKIYDVLSGGSPLFSETQNVAVSNGVFSVQIGAVSALALNFDRPYFLGVAINGDAEMTPRQPLAAAPYALLAAQAELLSNAAQTQSNTLLDNLGNVGQYNAISIGLDGFPVISYQDVTNSKLKVAKCVNVACAGTPVVTTVDGSANALGNNTSITVPPDGLPIIAYRDTSANLRVAKCANPDCSGTATTTPLGAGGFVASIAIAGDGLPVIVHSTTFAGPSKIVKCGNAACTASTTISVSTQLLSVAVGADGVPVAVGGSAVGFFRCTDVLCTAITSGRLPAPGVTAATSLAIGSDGQPVASFRDGTGASDPFMVARCRDAACYSANASGTVATVATNAANNTFDYSTSIAIGADGLPVVAIFDPEVATLRVVRCATSDCQGIASTSTPVTLPPSGPSGIGQYRLHLSLAIGNDGLPVISYYDAPNRSLRVLKCANASCTTGPVWRR